MVRFPPSGERWLRMPNDSRRLGTVCGNAGGNIPANHKEYQASQNAKIPTNMLQDSSKFVGILDIVPPQGL